MEPPDDKEKKKDGQLIKFPGGKSVNPAGLGAPFVIGPSAHVPTAEIIDPQEAEKLLRDRTEFVRNQELVRATESHAPTGNLIDIILQEIAEEAAHIKFERRQLSKAGKPTINHTVMRVTALKQLAETLLKRKETDLAAQLDLKSPRMQRIVQIFLEFIYDAMTKSGISEEDMEVVLQTMKSNMLDFEKRMLESEG